MGEKIHDFMIEVAAKNPGETEFLQAVEEVAEVVIPFMQENPKYNNKMLLERMVEPERVLMFRVPWLDNKGNTQVNRGYRIEFNSAIGPYKGGLRFHPSVNLSILKFTLIWILFYKKSNPTPQKYFYPPKGKVNFLNTLFKKTLIFFLEAKLVACPKAYSNLIKKLPFEFHNTMTEFAPSILPLVSHNISGSSGSLE